MRSAIWQLGSVLLAAAGLAVAAAPASAAWTFRVQPATVTVASDPLNPQTVTLTVALTSDPGDADLLVSSFDARLELVDGPGGVAVTAGTMPAADYIFQGNSLFFTANIDPGGQAVSLSDNADNPLFVTVPGNGASVLLGELTVTVAANAPAGTTDVRFDPNLSGLFDDTFEPIGGLSFVGGQVVVTAAPAAVPAPPAAALFAVGLVLLRAGRRP